MSCTDDSVGTIIPKEQDVAEFDYAATVSMADGIKSAWSADDEIGALGSMLSPSGKLYDRYYKLTTGADKLLDGGNAVFSGSVKDGDYIFYYPYGAGVVKDGAVEFTIPVTQTQSSADDNHIGGHDVLVSPYVAVSADKPADKFALSSIYAVASIPVVLSPEDPATDVKVTGVTLSLTKPIAAGVAYSVVRTDEGCQIVAQPSATTVSELELKVENSPVLGSEPFNVTMLAPVAAFAADELTVTVHTTHGDESIRQGAIEFKAGAETNMGVIAVKTEDVIHNAAEWNAIIEEANAAGETADIFIGDNSFTITSADVTPTVPVIIRGTGTVTLDFAGAQSTRIKSAAASNQDTNPTMSWKGLKLTNTSLQIKEGILRLDGALELSGAHIGGSGRIVASGDFTTAGTSAIGSRIVVSGDKLINNGEVENNGNVYYKSESGSTVGTYTVNQPQSAKSLQLPNSGFEDWYKAPVPNAAWDSWYATDETSFNNDTWMWDSGNAGTALMGKFPTINDPDVKHGGQYSVRMESQYVVIKFAAGNLIAGRFTGLSDDFLFNALFTFGRPFAALPLSLKGYYKYDSAKINYVNGQEVKTPTDDDSFDIYIALSTKTYDVNTGDLATYPDLANDDSIVAYGRLSDSRSTDSFQEFDITLNYKTFTTAPQYIIVVATGSKDGSSFTGGVGSKLYLDDLELTF
jgi:hypothetical protein